MHELSSRRRPAFTGRRQPGSHHESATWKRWQGYIRSQMFKLSSAGKYSGLHTPPGNPKWHLPSADMKMVFQGRTPHQLALQIMDYNKNGHKNKKQLLEHARDTLVKAGWNMGEGRTPPPLSHDAFLKVWDTWIKKGDMPLNSNTTSLY